nr:uncharacterized protein LOC129445914 [Misgurnus anguillicaudatus]XP_055062881.1 uncharacterized protein LOC129445914 [Misgurnus anguillicaudatus]
MLYRYMMVFLASIYGQRCCVYQNMTIEEVRNAVHSSDTWLINVNMDKTNQAFGPAQIALSKEEYAWFTRFLEIKNELVGGPGAKFFFFTSSTKACKNLNNYFQAVLVDIGLPGSPTFTDLRSAIVTCKLWGPTIFPGLFYPVLPRSASICPVLTRLHRSFPIVNCSAPFFPCCELFCPVLSPLCTVLPRFIPFCPISAKKNYCCC